VLDAERNGIPSKLNDKKLMDISDGFRPLSTLVAITFYKCTATFRTHCTWRWAVSFKLRLASPNEEIYDFYGTGWAPNSNQLIFKLANSPPLTLNNSV
jgi:hypothetical protein